MRILMIICFLLCSFVLHSQDDKAATVKTIVADGISIKSYNFLGVEPMLATESDTTYVVNFWATWCGPCVKEMPHFEKLGEQYKSKKVKVLLISLDFPKQVSKNLVSFIKRKNIRQEIIHLDDPDANAWIGKVDPEWSGAIPATLIFNRNSRKFYEQSFTYKELETALNELLIN